MNETLAPTRLPRRRLLTAGGTIGALAAGTAALPLVRPAEADPAPTKPPIAEPGGGYRLSEHVRRYYQTAKV
jgi:hypothetical protein